MDVASKKHYGKLQNGSGFVGAVRAQYQQVHIISLLFGSSLGHFRVKKFRLSQPRGEISELFLVKNKEKALKTEVFRAFCGGDKRDRTADLLNAIQALSQLSYTPILVALSQAQGYYNKHQRKMQALFLIFSKFFYFLFHRVRFRISPEKAGYFFVSS